MTCNPAASLRSQGCLAALPPLPPPPACRHSRRHEPPRQRRRQQALRAVEDKGQGLVHSSEARPAQPFSADQLHQQQGQQQAPVPAAAAAPALARCPERRRQWDAATRQLVRLATLATLADAAVRAVGQAAAAPGLPADAWVPLASNLTSFLILSSTFVDDGEAEAAACYLAGLACTLGLLAQAYLLHAVPAPVFCAASLLVAGSAAVNAAKLAGRLEGPGPAARLWGRWRSLTCCVGWAMVPQIAYLSVVLPATAGAEALAGAIWGPAAVSLGAGAMLVMAVRERRLPASWGCTWDVASWTATLLFMLEPLAALAAAARCPEVLLSISPADFLLPALVTGLQVPRALRAGDHMWCTGTSWSTLFACLQASVVAAAHGQLGVAAAALAAPLLGATWLLRTTAAREYGSNSPLAPLQRIAAGYSRDWQPLQELVGRRRMLRWAVLVRRSAVRLVPIPVTARRL